MHFVPPAELCFKPDPGEGWFSFCRREKATRVLKGQEEATRGTLVIANVPPPHSSFSPRPITCREPPAAALCGPSGAGSAAGSTGQPAGAGRGCCPHRGRRAARTAPAEGRHLPAWGQHAVLPRAQNDLRVWCR